MDLNEQVVLHTSRSHVLPPASRQGDHHTAPHPTYPPLLDVPPTSSNTTPAPFPTPNPTPFYSTPSHSTLKLHLEGVIHVFGQPLVGPLPAESLESPRCRRHQRAPLPICSDGTGAHTYAAGKGVLGPLHVQAAVHSVGGGAQGHVNCGAAARQQQQVMLQVVSCINEGTHLQGWWLAYYIACIDDVVIDSVDSVEQQLSTSAS